MVSRFVTRQLAAAVMGSVLLGGCSYLDFFEHPRGVGIAAPSEIAEYVKESENVVIQNAASLERNVTAGEYLIASVGYTNERCHDFFDSLERFKDDNRLLNKVLNAAVAAGAPMLGLSATAKSVSQFASAVTLATQINTEAADVYAFSTFKDHLKSHVSDAMSNFRKRNGITTLTRSLIGVNDFTSVSPATKVNPIDYAYEGPPSCAAYNTSVSYTTKEGETVSSASAAYEIDSCRVNNFLNSKNPMHMMVSRNIAADYASLCSVSNMKKIIIDVFAATETKMKDSDSTNTETKGKTSEQLAEAKDAVIEAKDAAVEAKAAANKSAAKSEAAEQSAEKAKVAKQQASTAKIQAENAKTDALDAKEDAEKAQSEAEKAKVEAKNAAKDAVRD